MIVFDGDSRCSSYRAALARADDERKVVEKVEME